tara:strand:+ start:845 stop:1489 length:645 start_codon:yes stop_codon:yes gene_type:complete
MTEEDNLLNADIPEKFKDPETGAVKIDALAKSYRALEHKLSQSPKPPKSPEEYCINCDHGLFKPDETVNKRLHDMGFTHEQAQVVYDLAAEKMVPMMREVAADLSADREVEKLINHFGGAQQWKDISRQLLAFGQKNLPADVLDNLSSSYEGVMALHRMMQGHEPRLNRNSTAAQSHMNASELSSMMRDPKYWRDKDPAFIAKVTEGFQNMYGE